MPPLRQLAVLLVIAYAVAAGSGCASNVIISDQFGDRIPKRVAVLPFSSNISMQSPAVMARDICYRHLAPRRFADVELFDVDDRLEKAGLITRDQILHATAQDLGAALECDAVVYGTIDEFFHFWALVMDWSSVEVKVRMVSTQTGEILWTGSSYAYSLSAGVDPFSLSISMFRGINAYEQLVLRLNEAFQAIWDQIPGQ